MSTARPWLLSSALAALLVACGGGGGPTGGEPPVADGNDTFATSQPVTVGSSTAGVIASTTDDDWYRFTTGSAGQVIVMLSALSADADLALVDAGQVVLGTSTGAGTADEVISHPALGGGTFHAHVIPLVADTSYILRVGFVPAGIVDGNDTFGAAQPMPIGSMIAGAIASNVDEDWYYFTTTAGGTVTVTLDGLFGDADLELYGELSFQLVDGSYFANTTPDVVTYTTPGAVTYHVRVLSQGAITPYTLEAVYTP